MSDRAALVVRLAPLGLVVVLAVAMLLPPQPGLTPPARDPDLAESVATTLDGLPEGAIVVVGFDPDIGTYAEIRPGVRALLGELADRDARLVTVSLTPEGRALLAAEVARIGVAGDEVIELGFVAGAEAGLVALSRSAPTTSGPADVAARLGDDGLDAADLLVVVGGNDIGPRSWIEQVLPRVGEVPMIALAPTVLLPELLPFVETGLIDALVGTPGDALALRDGLLATDGDEGDLAGGSGVAADTPVDGLALLLGLVAALLLLAHALAARAFPDLPFARPPEGA